MYFVTMRIRHYKEIIKVLQVLVILIDKASVNKATWPEYLLG